MHPFPAIRNQLFSIQMVHASPLTVIMVHSTVVFMPVRRLVVFMPIRRYLSFLTVELKGRVEELMMQLDDCKKKLYQSDADVSMGDEG